MSVGSHRGGGCCVGDTGVEIEDTVSAGEVDVSMSMSMVMGKRLMLNVSGLAWKVDWP